MTDDEVGDTGKISIESKMKQLGSLVFSYEMMNQPIDEMQAEFKKEHIQFSTMERVKELETTCYVTIDSAVSEKESADFTGVTINWISKDNKWYINTYRLKINTRELIDHIFYVYETYNPVFIGLEKTTFTMAIQPFIQEEMRKRNKFITITPIEHKGINKELRIRGLIPRWENKSIYLVGDNTELIDEMRVFPNGQNDDVLDSLAYQTYYAKAPMQKKQPLIVSVVCYYCSCDTCIYIFCNMPSCGIVSTLLSLNSTLLFIWLYSKRAVVDILPSKLKI